MKNHLLIALIAIIASLMPSFAFAQKGESAFGVQTGYTSTNESAILGIFYQYSLSEKLRISPEIGCVLRHKNHDAFTADVNFHFPLRLKSDNMDLYPLAGINYSSWSLHHLHIDDTDDVSSRASRFGANIGAGYQYNASSTLKLKIEAKYTFTKKYSTFVIDLGIGYRF